MNVQKKLQELDNERRELHSLSPGKDNDQIVAVGCRCLSLALKLYSELEGNTSSQVALLKFFVETYYYVFKVIDIYSFPEVEKQLPFKALKLFAVFLKDVHATLAFEARAKKMNRESEYHLKKAVAFHPSEELTLALAFFYMENNEFRSASHILQKYEGIFSSHLFYNKLICLTKLCDFERLTKELPILKALLDEGDENCSCMCMLKIIGLDNQIVFKATKNFQKKFEGKQDFTFLGSMDQERKIRLAYIGSSFIPHAQSFQFGKSFFKEHDEKFDLFIYSLKGDGTSETEEVIKKQVNHYVNAAQLNAEALLERIREDQIDIIVNCDGYAVDARVYVILSRRAAPIQIEYLGYPGTSGASYMDYFIGDPVSTPIDTLGPYFTEKLILLPDTYQLTEHREIFSGLPMVKMTPQETRETLSRLIGEQKESLRGIIIEFLIKDIIEGVRYVYHHLEKGDQYLFSLNDQIAFLQEKLKQGLIEGPLLLSLQRSMLLKEKLTLIVQGDRKAEEEIYPLYIDKLYPSEKWVDGRFIFCSSNNHAKLSLEDILCWNEILKRVKNSVLILLLFFSDEAKENLIQWFDPEIRERIYFVGNSPKLIHMHRLRGMDLLLDSFHWGAHTTAGDAIWAQVPVATCLGECMESRVCSSVLSAAGLGEFVAKDRQGYIDFAVRCATDPDYYNEILEKLQGARNSPLFDRELYVKNLTAGYQRAWELFCEGKAPENIKIL